MGDAGTETENAILQSHIIPKTTLLKAGHHGSKNSTGDDWLDTVSPDFVIFSAGRDNKYKFPHSDTQMRCHNAHARTFRTDLHGAIRFESDGRSVDIQTAF